MGVYRVTPPATATCLSYYLSPVSRRHTAIRDASALVRGCLSVNTSLLVVCAMDPFASSSVVQTAGLHSAAEQKDKWHSEKKQAWAMWHETVLCDFPT